MTTLAEKFEAALHKGRIQAAKEYAVEATRLEHKDETGDSYCWDMEQFMSLYEIALAKPVDTVSSLFDDLVQSRAGNTTKKVLSQGNHSDKDVTLNAINRLWWKPLTVAAGRIMYPALDKDLDDENALFITEVAPRLASLVRCYVKDFDEYIGESKGVDDNYVAYADAAWDKKIYAPRQRLNRMLPPPAVYAALLRNGDHQTHSDLVKARIRKGEKHGLTGTKLIQYSEGLRLKNGEWNLPKELVKGKMDAREVYIRDLATIGGIEEQLMKTKAYLAYALENNGDIELFEAAEVAVTQERGTLISRSANFVANKAWNELVQAMNGPGIDSSLPDTVEDMMLTKVGSSFERKGKEAVEASLDYDSGNNLSGMNKERKIDPRSEEYWENRATQYADAYAKVSSRIARKIEDRERIGNPGIIGISGTIVDEVPEDEENYEY